jgi:hypothetical protein
MPNNRYHNFQFQQKPSYHKRQLFLEEIFENYLMSCVCTVANHVDKHFLAHRVKKAWGGGVFIIVSVSRSSDNLCLVLWDFLITVTFYMWLSLGVLGKVAFGSITECHRVVWLSKRSVEGVLLMEATVPVLRFCHKHQMCYCGYKCTTETIQWTGLGQ